MTPPPAAAPQGAAPPPALPRPLLPQPLVLLVTDRTRCGGRSLAEVVDAAVEGGVGAVEVREKDLPAGELLGLALRLREIAAGRALLLVNDRADVAVAADLDGVHLGEESLPVSAARNVAGGRRLIGRSVHSVSGARAAAAAGVDYLVLGTLYATSSKPGLAPQGLGVVRAAAAAVEIPVLGIGGITPARAADVVAAGAAGVAVISAICEAPDPAAAAGALRAAVARAWRTRKREVDG